MRSSHWVDAREGCMGIAAMDSQMNWRDNEVLYRWSMRDAEWWQFWRPQSGLIGGVIVALLIELIVIGVYICVHP